MPDTADHADYERTRTLTVGSLFSGIGGVDLGLERAGMKVIWQSEIDPYAVRVLAKHWPAVPNLGDVTEIDWSTVERPDVVAGGFPCQPVSQAGKRLAQADHRWLWPEYARALRHLRPDHVIVENVPGLLVRGMPDVLGDLAELGYDAEWAGIPAAAVGAPHLRWRIFLVAHADGRCLRGRGTDTGDGRAVLAEGQQRVLCRSGGGQAALADAERPGRPRPVNPERRARLTTMERQADPVFGGRSLPQRRPWWDVEPPVGRVVNGVPSRVDRLRCLGNAVVPQVAEFVGHLLVSHIDGHDGYEPEHNNGGRPVTHNDGTRRCKECSGLLDQDGYHKSEWADCSRSQVRLNDGRDAHDG